MIDNKDGSVGTGGDRFRRQKTLAGHRSVTAGALDIPWLAGAHEGGDDEGGVL